MKKSIVLFLAVLLAFQSLVFATGQQEAADDDSPITLEFWTHEDPNRDAIENRYVEEFMAANPGVTINRVTHSSKKIFELVLTAFAANAGPDIFNMQIEQAYSYIINERVAPVNYKAIGYSGAQEMLDQYIDGSMDSVVYDGEVYGIPLELNNWAVYINKRVFADAGLDAEKDYPRTWEQMADISEKLVLRDGQIITRRGFDFRYPYYLISMVPMVEQLGGKLVSDDGKTAIINDKAWIEFLTFMQEWGPNGRNLGSPPTPMPENSSIWTITIWPCASRASIRKPGSEATIRNSMTAATGWSYLSPPSKMLSTMYPTPITASTTWSTPRTATGKSIWPGSLQNT